jgi:hypothetical protein
VASEAGHWYDAKTGEPRYTVKAKDGTDRPTTLRDARKYGYVPSVTTITRIMAAPGLDTWKQRQVLMAALTLTRTDGEPDDAWIGRIMEDSKAQTKAAAERGTALHGDVERYLLSLRESVEGEFVRYEYGHVHHIAEIEHALLENQVRLQDGNPEHSFAHADGFGGKVDWHNDSTVVDFKTKDAIGDKTAKELAYDEHACQLAAYAYGLGIVAPRCLNVFVGVNDCKVVVVEHDQEAIGRGLGMFLCCLNLWKIKNNVVTP